MPRGKEQNPGRVGGFEGGKEGPGGGGGPALLNQTGALFYPLYIKMIIFKILQMVLDSGSLDTQQLFWFFSLDLTRVFRSWRRRQGCNVNLRSFVETKVRR